MSYWNGGGFGDHRWASPRDLVARQVLKKSGLATGQSPLHRKPGQSGTGLLRGGLHRANPLLPMGLIRGSRRGGLGGQFPLQFEVACFGRLFGGLSSSDQRIGALDAVFAPLLPFAVALFTDVDGVVTQFRAERLLYEQDRLEGRDVHLAENPMEAPADALPAHAKGLVNFFAVRTLEHQVAWPTRPQLDPQVLRVHQALQGLQELLVLLGQFHIASPGLCRPPAGYRSDRHGPGR